jgi:tetratricopeptide (TPR) repeat protein
MSLTASPRPQGPTRSRRPRVPPAITRGSEAIPALAVVEEIPGDLGVVLWRSVRNVVLWARTPEASRASLFDAGAADARAAELARVQPEAELLAPLSVVVALLENPRDVEVRRLVNACRRVAAWAEARGALGTALEFAQAAALARPDSAPLAFAVGRLARRRAEYDRAESWYMRAIVQARQAGDWRSYALAFSGIGNMYVRRGNYRVARKAFVRSLRAARRHHLRDVCAMAYHDLYLCAADTGEGSDAGPLAEQAFRAYGAAHPHVPRLAYDVAYNWVQLGNFVPAARVAEALLPHFTGPTERALVLGLLARAAGGAGERRAFEAAAEAVEAMVAEMPPIEGFTGALLGVANGAASLGDHERAVHAAGRARELARHRREGRVELAAEAVADSANARRNSDASPGAPAPGAFELAEKFVRALAGAAG